MGSAEEIRKMGGRLRAKCQPQTQAKQGAKVLGGGLCLLFLPSGTALLNQLASKAYTCQSSCQIQPWILLLRESHGPRDVGTGGASELGVAWGPEDDVISSLPPSLCPAAMERQGHGAHGHPRGQPQTLLSHGQRGRHRPAECEQIPLCDPFRRRLRCVQLR